MTPFQITLLFDIMCSPADLEQSSAPIFNSTIAGFLQDDLIKPNSAMLSGFLMTDRGLAYVKGLQALPLPTATWNFKFPEHP